MPIKFLKEKQYVVISHPNRKRYYEELKEAFSLSLDIMSLEEMEELFLSFSPKERFVDKEIIISGYYTKGDLIAHYLNSLSGNMIIGYELESERENHLPIKRFSKQDDELTESIKFAKEKYEKYLSKPLYFMNINDNEKDLIKSKCPFINVLDDYVCPLNGEIIFLHLDNLLYLSAEDGAALKRTLKSTRLTFVTESEKNKF